MTRSMWLVVAATLALVPYTAYTQTLVTSAPCRSTRRMRRPWRPRNNVARMATK
jgi:hypothetical protein